MQLSALTLRLCLALAHGLHLVLVVFLVGFDAGNALFDTAEETGGSADAITVSHTHTATSTDSGHLHTQTEYNCLLVLVTLAEAVHE
jgi:hypothetical protein